MRIRYPIIPPIPRFGKALTHQIPKYQSKPIPKHLKVHTSINNVLIYENLSYTWGLILKWSLRDSKGYDPRSNDNGNETLCFIEYIKN